MREVLDRAVAAAAVEIVDEGRAVDRGEDGVVAADRHVPLRVARMLDELAAGTVAQRLAGEAAGKADARALDVGSRRP